MQANDPTSEAKIEGDEIVRVAVVGADGQQTIWTNEANVSKPEARRSRNSTRCACPGSCARRQAQGNSTDGPADEQGEAPGKSAWSCPSANGTIAFASITRCQSMRTPRWRSRSWAWRTRSSGRWTGYGPARQPRGHIQRMNKSFKIEKNDIITAYCPYLPGKDGEPARYGHERQVFLRSPSANFRELGDNGLAEPLLQVPAFPGRQGAGPESKARRPDLCRASHCPVGPDLADDRSRHEFHARAAFAKRRKTSARRSTWASTARSASSATFTCN